MEAIKDVGMPMVGVSPLRPAKPVVARVQENKNKIKKKITMTQGNRFVGELRTNRGKRDEPTNGQKRPKELLQ